ncbi:hypothetical protein RND81_12G081300 [Saponaria officinalis]|uniref:BTB/POZ and TAZ domain-containing protein 3 n=1 Tax=Saponaria officinalis TaxID=3572 RepID=A0AAW1H7Z6_SAPOF
MASVISDNSTTFPDNKRLEGSVEISRKQETTAKSIIIASPPPIPESIFPMRNKRENSSKCSCIPEQTRDVWDRLFKGGFGADVYIITQDQLTIPAHLNVLSIASPIIGKCLQDSKTNNGLRYLKMPGVPHGAVSTFIRFLYSSCYEEGDMRNFALHLLALSHSFVVPLLKQTCVEFLENSGLTTENVIDVLQLARNCNAPRLSLACTRMVVKHFETVVSTDGWKVMIRVNPDLELELLESLVEADSMKGEKARKKQEKKVYSQLHKAIEGLVHICQDGCSTIGPRDKILKQNKPDLCGFSGCKAIEMLVRHFFSCKVRVPGGCAHCKRMWQLFELHSCMCDKPESCHVPLCRHFKEKMRQQTKKEEAKWELLVKKVKEAKKTHAFAALYDCIVVHPDVIEAI